MPLRPRPPGLEGLPEPADLHRAFSEHGPVDWGRRLPSAAEIADLHGTDATAKSLRSLHRAVATEPQVTAAFLNALPADGSAYQLGSRIKSPASLARKFRDVERKTRQRPPEDILRYTGLTESPDELVEVARHTVDELRRTDWQVEYAMHSYTEGSRYKGLHAYLATPENDRVEVQFHSVESAKVKEATTRWYEIERSAQSSPQERTAARMQCVQLSAPLVQPPGIDKLTHLGGRRVAVNNYSDSRKPAQSNTQTTRQSPARPARQQASTIRRNDGVNR